MKTNKLSISALQKAYNKQEKLNNICGGGPQPGAGRCTCGCHYENNGGSCEYDNSEANFKDYLYSPEGGWSCVDNTLEDQQRYLIPCD